MGKRGFLLFYLFSILYMKHVCVHVHLMGILGMLYRLALAIGRETRLCNLGCKDDDALSTGTEDSCQHLT